MVLPEGEHEVLVSHQAVAHDGQQWVSQSHEVHVLHHGVVGEHGFLEPAYEQHVDDVALVVDGQEFLDELVYSYHMASNVGHILDHEVLEDSWHGGAYVNNLAFLVCR